MVPDVADARSSSLILAEALQRVPGYQPDTEAVPIAHPAGSHFNQSYEVRTGEGRFVVRLSPAPDAWLAGNRSVERHLHALAAAAGLAPPIVHADPKDRWLITRFVDGVLWTTECFDDAARLTQLAAALRRLHALPAPATGRFDLLYALDAYVGLLETAGAVRPGALAGLMKQAAQNWRLSGAGSRAPAILHHDLNASNIIDSGTQLLLLDWECAAVGDPLFDVACVLSYYDSSRAHASLLLRESGLGEVTAVQLEAAVWLFDLHTFLWYRERRLRITPDAAELAAEQRLLARLGADRGGTGAGAAESAN
jgi:thiamine kinase